MVNANSSTSTPTNGLLPIPPPAHIYSVNTFIAVYTLPPEMNTNTNPMELKINILESVQIDFKTEKPKKRRCVDEYDYNDPFLEPFEGEFDVVELECKLENFFIYKGAITEDPKRIARRLTNTLKRQKQADPAQSSGQEAEDQCNAPQFEFEKQLASTINQNCKYKKDTRFENAFLWTVYVQEPATDFEMYLKFRMLAAFREYGHISIECPAEPERKEFSSELSELHDDIEMRFKRFMKQASDEKNFSRDMKSFEKFKDEAFVDEIVAFLTKYTAYYVCKTDRNAKHTKNLSVEYLSAVFPSQCTNKVKIKHYVLKKLGQRMRELGFDAEKVLNGEFVLKDAKAGTDGTDKGDSGLLKSDTSLTEAPYSPTNTFVPSFNENSVSIGSEINPSSTSPFANSLFSAGTESSNKAYTPSIVLSSNFINGKQSRTKKPTKDKNAAPDKTADGARSADKSSSTDS